MNDNQRKIALAVLVVASTAGCGVDPPSFVTLPGEARPASTRPPLSMLSVLDHPQKTLLDQNPDFQAPYPERENPFSFPADVADANFLGGPAHSVAQVQVVGFADVEEPRVFLRIRNETKSLAVGEQMDGVEVVKINPPAAELRLGSLLWTVTMFDRSRD